MSKLPAYTYKDVIKKLKSAGFIYDRNAKGSHEVWYHPEKKLRTTVTNHPGTLSKGVVRAIIRQIGTTPDEFLKI